MSETKKCVNCLTEMTCREKTRITYEDFYRCPNCKWCFGGGIWYDEKGKVLDLKRTITDKFMEKHNMIIDDKDKVGTKENREKFKNCLVCGSELKDGYMVLTVKRDDVKIGELCSEECFDKYEEQSNG